MAKLKLELSAFEEQYADRNVDVFDALTDCELSIRDALVEVLKSDNYEFVAEETEAVRRADPYFEEGVTDAIEPRRYRFTLQSEGVDL